MMGKDSNALALAALGVFACAGIGAAHAAAGWDPSKPVEIIVPAGAGGASRRTVPPTTRAVTRAGRARSSAPDHGSQRVRVRRPSGRRRRSQAVAVLAGSTLSP